MWVRQTKYINKKRYKAIWINPDEFKNVIMYLGNI